MGLSRKVIGTAAVFAACFLILYLTMDRELNIYDEGLVLVDAMRARAGELVHRDYYANYAPGMSYMVAAAWGIFGGSFLVACLVGIAMMAGIVAAVFALLQDRVRMPATLLGAGIVLCWLIANPAYLYPSLPCALLALAAMILLTRDGATERAGSLLGAGACAGGAAYFRYDTGFFMVVAQCLAIMIFLAARHGLGGWRVIARSCFLCGLGAGLVFLPGAIAYLAVAPIRGFYNDIIDYGLHVYPPNRHLPFPGPLRALTHPAQLALYVPLIVVAAAVPAIVGDLRRARDGGPALPVALALAVLTVVLYYKGLIRPVPVHMLLAIIPAVPLALLCAGRYSRGSAIGRIAAAGLVALALVPAVHAAAVALATRPARRMPIGRLLAASTADRDEHAGEICAAAPHMAGAWLPSNYARAARFLAANTAPGERIFVGVTRQDHIFVNPVALHFAAQRLPTTHWAQFDPGLQTRADVQRDMVAELATTRPRWVVRDGTNDWVREPNRSAGFSGVRLVDSYLDARYRPVAAAGATILWLRDDVPAPPLDRGPTECRLQPPPPATAKAS